MYAKTLKFLTNLLFKQVFMGFLTRRKKREPMQWRSCWICGYGFRAFNKRQRVCRQKLCVKTHRAQQYRARIQLAKAERKGKIEAIQARDRETAAIIIGPTLESEEYMSDYFGGPRVYIIPTKACMFCGIKTAWTRPSPTVEDNSVCFHCIPKMTHLWEFAGLPEPKGE